MATARQGRPPAHEDEVAQNRHEGAQQTKGLRIELATDAAHAKRLSREHRQELHENLKAEAVAGALASVRTGLIGKIKLKLVASTPLLSCR